MKTFVSDIVPKLTNFGKKLDNLTLLTDHHWVVINEIQSSKCVYIFRSKGELLVSINGKVEKGKWEYLGNNSLLIERTNETYLFRHGFYDENILALKVDGKDEYAFLVNETKYDSTIDSIDKVLDFLRKRYLSKTNESGLKKETNDSPISLHMGSTGYVSGLEITFVVTAIERISSTWTSEYFAFKIVFSDNRVGKLFMSTERKKRYYFVAAGYKRYYKTIPLTIKAIHHFLCYGDIL